MNNYECIPHRPANDYEHASIEKQLIGVAKGQRMAGFLLIAFALAAVVFFVQMIIKGINGTRIVLLIVIALAIVLYLLLSKDLFIPCTRIPKRQYVLLDCIVTDVIRKPARYGGYHYWANVFYQNGSAQRVIIANGKTAERIEIGKPAVVVFFLNMNGRRRVHAYSLCVIQ